MKINNYEIKPYANLQGANLRGANLQEANLWGADLQRADLQGANLREANLRGADLWGANLRGANLQRADLQGADLQEANLREANLQRADLQRADLQGADLEFYFFPSIRTISSIELNHLTSTLQLELMRRDAFSHPHPELFDTWKETGICPYNDVERFWLFNPNPKYWIPGLPEMMDRELIVEICKSQGWKIRNII